MFKPIFMVFFQKHRNDLSLLVIKIWNNMGSPVDPYASHVPRDPDGRYENSIMQRG